MCGLAAGTGGSDAPPTPVGATVADQHGATLLAMSVLAALLRRERAGIGGRVDVNLLNAALDLQIEALTYFINGARKPPRSSTSLATWFHPAPYGVYPTADGHLAARSTRRREWPPRWSAPSCRPTRSWTTTSIATPSVA
jgi:crotonobetainyl-CoA:carnitine CoA-transferase CaiB-like acyl-CoA transferase